MLYFDIKFALLIHCVNVQMHIITTKTLTVITDTVSSGTVSCLFCFVIELCCIIIGSNFVSYTPWPKSCDASAIHHLISGGLFAGGIGFPTFSTKLILSVLFHLLISQYALFMPTIQQSKSME